MPKPPARFYVLRGNGFALEAPEAVVSSHDDKAAAEAAAKAYSARTLHPAYVVELHSRITASVVRHQVARKPWKAAP